MNIPTEADRIFLQRCLALASRGQSRVEPNPRVGAVVVYQGRIIGEGWHQQYGGPHAEVNAIRSVTDPSLLPFSTLYVSLEPCNHHGKTPPCSLLILESRIPRVVVGCTDPNPLMGGKSLEFLAQKGVEVVLNDAPEPFQQLLRHFWVNQSRQRPYITLKWAESLDGYIGRVDAQGQGIRTPISGPETALFTHQLRAEHTAIGVGANTVRIDQPSLKTRHFPGPDPIKVIWDHDLSIPSNHPIFAEGKCIVINRQKERLGERVQYLKTAEDEHPERFLNQLYMNFGVGSLLVEGGSQILHQFLSNLPVDEVHQIIGDKRIERGIPAPLPSLLPEFQYHRTSGEDQINSWYRALSTLLGE